MSRIQSRYNRVKTGRKTPLNSSESNANIEIFSGEHEYSRVYMT